MTLPTPTPAPPTTLAHIEVILGIVASVVETLLEVLKRL